VIKSTAMALISLENSAYLVAFCFCEPVDKVGHILLTPFDEQKADEGV
jgi:hypothetical protein